MGKQPPSFLRYNRINFHLSIFIIVPIRTVLQSRSQMQTQCSYCDGILQFTSYSTETVQHTILSNAVDPLSSWGCSGTYKISTFSFTRTEATHNLNTISRVALVTHSGCKHKQYNMTFKSTYIQQYPNINIQQRIH